MRGLLFVAGVAALAGCTAPEAPPVVSVNTAWRTSRGEPIAIAEFDALRQACAPRPTKAAFDTERPMANPLRDNPAYHPGGEGLASTPPTGIAADRPAAPAARRVRDSLAPPLEACLEDKGLTRAR